MKYFANVANFPIKFASHPHADFQLSRCRNEGIALSSAPYLLITDGDCVLPPDHLYWHLNFRKPGIAIAGDCYRLSESHSNLIDEKTIREGELLRNIESSERRRIRWKALRGWTYSRLSLSMLPRLTGCNIAVWRSDLDRINGFDENFVGWGLEDRDLQRRLEMSGVRCRSILHKTAACHLWHPTAPSFSRKGLGTKNHDYYNQKHVVVHCEKGLAQRIPLTRNLLEQVSSPESDRQRVLSSDPVT